MWRGPAGDDERWGNGLCLPGPLPAQLHAEPIRANLPLIGAGEGEDAASNTILDAQDLNPVLDILSGGVATSGTAELSRCTIHNHYALGALGEGGGVYTIGTTMLTDCLVENNFAGDSGGGIAVFGGTTILAGTTQVRDNVADTGFGGSITSQSADLLSIADTCRVTQNTAPVGKGGCIAKDSSSTVTLQGSSGTTSPSVVDNCRENCVCFVPRCAATPVSCPP